MNIPILIANTLTLLAFFIHTYVGDKEIRMIEPNDSEIKLEKFIMARSGWHWVSIDLLFASIGLGLINFTNFFENEKTILQLLTIYFFGYSVVWLLVIKISKQFTQNYLKLGQWILLLLISGLIYYGTN